MAKPPMFDDEEMAVRAEVGECTYAPDHEVTFFGVCIHCGAEFPEEDNDVLRVFHT